MASADTCSGASVAFWEYYAGLTSPAKTRYSEKVLTCGFECSEDLADYPSMEYPDIVNYLALQTSWITGQQMKAYKSMDAYNFFVSGWVNTIFTNPLAGTDKVIVTARVNRSQRARKTPLKTWLLAEKDGNVCMAHCNCMAGLCEACSHVGTLLFAIETGVRMRGSVTCTQEKSGWIMPSYVKEIPYIPVCEMDLSSAKKRHSSLGEQGSATPDPRERRNVQATTAEEEANLFERISNCCIKPDILSIVAPYNAAFVPVENKTMPKPLTALLNEENLGDTLQELQQKS